MLIFCNNLPPKTLDVGNRVLELQEVVNAMWLATTFFNSLWHCGLGGGRSERLLADTPDGQQFK
ncbi:hypothetical protein SV7mr_35510 [Stieleria bergensis]|uniref:Uncharacterized protein n=1 Tax=Stieleria bergensis TaxID=2528025 RepID=A0A517SYC0_9BACT|nr:hypothetical protein SV7mr_35510 [Planctomycetes bacterium SV_7m_r]